jgi:hypothetical protein
MKRGKIGIRVVQPMCHAVHQYRVKSRIAQENLEGARRRRVLAKYGLDLFPDSGGKHRHPSDLLSICPY